MSSLGRGYLAQLVVAGFFCFFFFLRSVKLSYLVAKSQMAP